MDPTARPGGWDANQAIAYSRTGRRRSNLAALRDVSADYGLSKPEAGDHIDAIVDTVLSGWREAIEFAELSPQAATAVRERAILHPAALDGYLTHHG